MVLMFYNFGRVMAELLYTQLNEDGREITNVVEAAIDVADAMLGSFLQ